MAKIGVFHTDLVSSIGGAQSVCVNTLDAVQYSYDVDLITLYEPSIDKLNDIYGTSIKKNNLSCKSPNNIFGTLLKNVSKKNKQYEFTCLKKSFLNKYLKDNLAYDLIISTDSEIKVNINSIQYIHNPSFEESTPQDLLDKSYDQLCGTVGSFKKHTNPEELVPWLKKAKLIVNSAWTSDRVKNTYNLPSSVVYPPVDTTGIEGKPWENKRDSFITISRLTPEKNILENISIVDELRELGYDINYTIIGKGTGSSYHIQTKKISEQRNYVSLFDSGVSREFLLRQLNEHKYGIHGKHYEHFGIAVAEMVAAGIIPFVPDSGGQTEIVDNINYLTYENKQDAVQKIDQLMSSSSIQKEVKNRLPDIDSKFGSERFQKEMFAHVQNKI